jgi:hypothetical protein
LPTGSRAKPPDDAILRVGTAGWSIHQAAAGLFPAAGTHLERYAQSRREIVHRRKLIEQLRREAPHLFAVSGIGMQSRGEAASLLAQAFGPLIICRRWTEMRRGEIVQDAFADADRRHD